MKQVFFLLVVIVFSINVSAQPLQWAIRTGGSTKDEGISLTIDAAGNSYSTGSFRGTVDFDAGAATANLTAVGDNDIFVSKLDASGNFVWAKSFGSAVYEVGIDIAVDASGNVYVTGNYSGSIDFDPGAGITTLTSAGNQDIFVLKLDNNGNFVLAKSMGGTGVDGGLSIAVDASRNIYTTGVYAGTSDFDPGAGVSSLSSLKAGDDIFVSKLSDAGDFLWARTAGSGNPDQGTAITVDATGNVFVTGFYASDANFNPFGSGNGGLFTALGGTDFFILKFDNAGIFVWVKSIGGTGNDVGYSIALDALGNIYTTGYFFGTTDFDPGAATVNLTSAGSNVDAFNLKMDASGNFVWAKNMGGTSGDAGYSISVDAGGNVYTLGGFAGTADFDPGVATSNITSAGLADVFISKLDASGNFAWAKTFGGTTDDIGYSIAMDATGNMYTTGIFSGTADFDPDASVMNLTSAGNNDIFNFKLGSVSLPLLLTSFEASSSGKDSYLTWITATEQNTDKFEIEKSNDGVVYRKIGSVKAYGNTNNIKRYNYTENNAAEGSSTRFLFYRLKQLDLDGQYTYSPTRTINLNGSANIQVYPNPAKNAITISVSIAEVGSTYTITDRSGRPVITGRMTSLKTLVNINGLASGIYLLNIGQSKNESIKIFKQ